jgi:dolichol-phosphate mannosyltransferase
VALVSAATGDTNAKSSSGGKTLVVVPTYNERDNVQELITGLLNLPDLEVLFVDDGSPDGTAQRIETAAVDDARIHLLKRLRKQGLGTAYVEGFRWGLAREFQAIVAMDADLSHDPSDIPRLLDALEGADLVIGSRYVDGGRVENWGLGRRSLSKGANRVVRMMLGYEVRDSTAGFRAFRPEALERIDYRTLGSRGYAFQIETTRRMTRSGGSTKEIPITFVERVRGNSKMDARVIAEAVVNLVVWTVRDRIGRRR